MLDDWVEKLIIEAQCSKTKQTESHAKALRVKWESDQLSHQMGSWHMSSIWENLPQREDEDPGWSACSASWNKHSKNDLKNQRFSFQTQLQNTGHQQVGAIPEAQEELNKYLKLQLCQQFHSTNKPWKEKKMLHHQIEAMRASPRLNLEGFPPVTDLEESKSRVQEADHKAVQIIPTDQRQTISKLEEN